MSAALPHWTVNILLWRPKDGSREIDVEVSAVTSREALIEAISRVELNEGELFHTVHIGKPCEDAAARFRAVMADGMAFMDRHDAAFRRLADG
jgi:hypothetical protein